MHRARDELEHAEWLADLEEIADALALEEDARTIAADLFLDAVPESARSKRAALGASVYAAALIAGQERSQRQVAEAADVSRITIQQRWKGVLENAGLEPPTW